LNYGNEAEEYEAGRKCNTDERMKGMWEPGEREGRGKKRYR
jgi:hypothetical protein